MPTPNGIRDAANTVRDNKNAVSQKSNTYERSVSSVAYAWKGDIGEAFKNATKTVKTKMLATITEYSGLNTKLINLSNSVRRADKEEEAKAKAAAKK